MLCKSTVRGFLCSTTALESFFLFQPYSPLSTCMHSLPLGNEDCTLRRPVLSCPERKNNPCTRFAWILQAGTCQPKVMIGIGFDTAYDSILWRSWDLSLFRFFFYSRDRRCMHGQDECVGCPEPRVHLSQQRQHLS